MLAQLAIRDIVLIDRLDLAFDRGLTVLTGETGAGKSILLDALTLALGGRGDGSLVRHGAAQGQVTAVFDIANGHPGRAMLAEAGIETDGEIVLKRLQHADGRTRAFVNGEPASVQVLRQIGAALVEIHGQHDDRAFVDPATHRAVLDAYGRLEAERDVMAGAFARLQAARAALAAQRARVDKARTERDFLVHAVDELGRLAAKPGEEGEFAERRQGMMQAEKVAQDLVEASEAISGPGSPGPVVSAALRKLERRAGIAPTLIDPPVKALDALLVALDEARSALERAVAAAAFEPKELEQVEERLFAIRGAARKYQTTPDALPALAERFAADLAAVEAGEERLAALEADAQAAEAAYQAAAAALSAARKKAGQRLDAAVAAELPPLKLDRAAFSTTIETDEKLRGPDGFDHVEFWVRTNPGTRPGPLVKVASGGELARFLLALKVVLADRGSAPTLVFDEVDTGVGGAVADAIGARLGRLAKGVQVIAVTHAPQVAARAKRHFLIAKQAIGKGERVATSVEALADKKRREEIARMLAGATITEEARAAAQRLIEGAR